ncbi:MAG: glutathione S-transferase N-terminal domain-containing protein [Gammaproteobacteria bacterium]|nr:glutathione S-transferase N-terminal domain-containing protein [Gammaproteobacteria bacterium]
MIDVYYWPTPNGWKVTIMLEECGLEYRVHAVDIGGGEQFKADFLRISPNNRMPAIIDNAPLGGGKPLALFESGAILEYLADKTGKFLPKEPAARYTVLQWAYWQMANLGPMMGNANHFKNYAKKIVDDEAQLTYGTKRFVGEVDRLCGVMDAQLGANRYLAGADYSIADMLSWSWAMLLEKLIDDAVWSKFPNLKRWVDEVGARPAVQKGRNVHKEWSERQLTEEQEKARREILFNQTNDKVRNAREEAARASS